MTLNDAFCPPLTFHSNTPLQGDEY